MPYDSGHAVPDALADLPDAEFVSHSRNIVGEPPAIMLENRSEMIQLLVESTPAVPLRVDEQALDQLQEHSGEA
ncbi:hypothetical protein OKC48_13730 [Methylorubrum extorquens]|uniref:hypothetical protein n=1 Tax=Methylorubrum extorquens TaxID=408 RepID=UPI002238C439|nr:hypothetical protein [Methylorubrum extorquens]UYW29515.1 hypothetical protein OKC48_13730 [Methylorubrum extorquens]